MTNSIASLLQIEKEDVHIEFAGLNHLVYGLHVYAKGKEVTQEVIQLLSDPKSQVTMRNIAPIPWQPDFLEALGVILCPYPKSYLNSSFHGSGLG